MEVPWLECHYNTTRGRFHAYPGSEAFDLPDLLNGRFGNHTIQEGTVFLQSWLFFGLLSETLGSGQSLDYREWVQNYDAPGRMDRILISPSLERHLRILE